MTTLKQLVRSAIHPCDSPHCCVEVHVGVGGEQLGGSLRELLSYFPASHYDLFIESEEESSFVPFDEGSAVLDSRFFLCAINTIKNA